MGNYCYWISARGDDNILEKKDSGGYPTLWIELMAQNCTVKMIKMANFMFYIYIYILAQ